MLAVNVRYDDKGVRNLTKALSRKLPDELDKSVFGYAKRLSIIMKRNALQDPLRPITSDRQRAVALIKAKKMSNRRSVITMPQSLRYLDSSRPHYYSIKRGRKIMDWARRNAGNAQIKNRSKFVRGPRGAITGGYIWFTPHRFVQKSLSESRNILPNELRKGITKAFKATAT